MADYLTTDTELTSIANAIRTKGGISSTLVYPQGFISAINDISSGDVIITDTTDSHGGTIRTIDTENATTIEPLSVTANGTYSTSGKAYSPVIVEVSGGGGSEDEIIARTISGTYVNSRVTNIGSYAFAYCLNLTDVSFPSCTNISSNAFYSCHNLSTVSFPACTSMGYYAFAYCSNLTDINFPSCTSIGRYAFSYCTGLSAVSFPICKDIDNYAFANCRSLTSVNLPSCKTVCSCAFYSCVNLSAINLPVCTTIENSVFTYCSSLTAVNFQACLNIGSTAFGYCYNLATVSLSACKSIGSFAFYQCRNLISLYLLGSYLASLLNSNAFSSSPIGGYTGSTGGVYGSIYVPASLLTQYQSATNWSYYSSRFVGI